MSLRCLIMTALSNSHHNGFGPEQIKFSQEQLAIDLNRCDADIEKYTHKAVLKALETIDTKSILTTGVIPWVTYSGRTSAHEHKFEDWADKGKNVGADCFPQMRLFDVQWSNCPVEVENEVRQLWRDYEFGNDNYYVKWSDSMAEGYPLIAEFMFRNGYYKSEEKILIHWWW